MPLVPNPGGVVLVEDIASLRPESAPGAGPAPSVDRALRELLGTAPNANDPQAFLGALERSITVSPAGTGAPPGSQLPATGDGRVWTWTPRGYSLQADLGVLTGAQASIYRRAQQALAESLPLLAGLEPLIPYDDDEAVASAREVVRSEFERVVAELGSEGGPSVNLVDQLFESLVGLDAAAVPPPAGPFPATTVGGHLGDLREHFGLKRELINTLDEERNFTNYLILSDYITSLFGEWINSRGAFTGAPGATAFFGTQLVLISRDLEVASESVSEVQAALDAVLIGPGERKTYSLTVGTAEVFLGQMLDWADHFLTVDARHLIETAGKEGAFSLVPTLNELATQVGAFAAAAVPTSPLPPGFSPLYQNAVVQSTLDALQGTLTNLATKIQSLGQRQPVIGFPLRPPALSAPPFPGDLAIGVRSSTNELVLRALTDADLSSTRAVMTLDGIRFGAPFVLIARAWEAAISRANRVPGTYLVVLERDGSDWPVRTHII